jgi:predicted RNA-binding protein with PUA domain
MADCKEMKKADVFVCKNCGLELRVQKSCTCGSGSTHACTVPLQCCGEDMKKK